MRFPHHKNEIIRRDTENGAEEFDGDVLLAAVEGCDPGVGCPGSVEEWVEATVDVGAAIQRLHQFEQDAIVLALGKGSGLLKASNVFA